MEVADTRIVQDSNLPSKTFTSGRDFAIALKTKHEKTCLPNQQPFTNSRSCFRAVNHRFGDGFKLRATLRLMSSIRLSRLRWAGRIHNTSLPPRFIQMRKSFECCCHQFLHHIIDRFTPINSNNILIGINGLKCR